MPLAAPKINIRIIAFLNIFHNFVKTKQMKSKHLLTAFLAAASLLAAKAEPPTRTAAIIQASERITLRLQGIGGDGYYKAEAKDLIGNTHELLLPSEAQPMAGQRIYIVRDNGPTYVFLNGVKFYDYSTAKPVKL